MKERVYTSEEVRTATLEYFEGDDIACDVWVSKYALRNRKGELLERTPDDMHRRLAREFARIEAKYPNAMDEEQIYGLLRGFKRIIPQGSPMSAVGNPYKVQSLSNCFVIESPKDAYASILRADQHIAQIQKRRGGVGVDLSNIRPLGVTVANAAGTSDGVDIFMERFSNTTNEVAQGGRRGALMETISCNHPDLERFITIKLQPGKVTGANVSVRVTDEFMRAVENDEEYVLRWPVEAPISEAKVTKRVFARQLWRRMMESVWGKDGDGGEPGILFWDRMLSETPADLYADKGFRTISTNPCGELGLNAHDSCRLLLLNLVSYVRDPYLPSASFNFDLFDADVRNAQRLMDDLVDLELEAVSKIIAKVEGDPESNEEKFYELSLWKKIYETCEKGRRTGTGITAMGDALAAIGLRYASPESIEFVERVYRTLAVGCHESSVELAKERGPFPIWEKGRHEGHPFFERLLPHCSEKSRHDFEKFGRRNIALTTTSPAGTVSLCTRTTSGIEPVYRLKYTRRKKLTQAEIDAGTKPDEIDPQGIAWKTYEICHPGLERWMRITREKDEKKSPYWNSTAADIDWVASVDLQAAAQRWVEHSISRTCNLPKDASIETMSEVYIRAWKSGCKGFTAFRDGSKKGVFTSGTETDQPKTVVESHAPKRLQDLPCEIHQVKVQGEAWTVIVGLLDAKPFEVFGGLSKHVEIPRKYKSGTLRKNGKVGGVATYNLMIPVGDEECIVFKDIVKLFDNPTHGSFSRMLSLSLRHGIPLNFVCDQLVKTQSEDMQSFSRVIARVLKTYIIDGTKSSMKQCPSCGGDELRYSEGCITCSCGWSKCS